MDFWIIAAAAGAGCLAQHLKNHTGGKHYLSDLLSASAKFIKSETSPIIQELQDKNYPFRRVLPENNLGEDAYREGNRASQDSSTAEMASTSRFDGENMVVSADNIMICSSLSNSNSLPAFFNNENVQDYWECGGHNIDEVHGDLSFQLSAREMRFSSGVGRNRSRLRSRRTNRQFIKPLASLQSCLLAQLYKEHSEIEEYYFSSINLPSTQTAQPFLVADGSRIISRDGNKPSDSPNGTGKYKLQKNTNSQDREAVLGVPRLPKFVPMECRKKAKSGKQQVARWSNCSRMVNGDHDKPPDGSSHGAVHFYFGLSIGIISSFLTNKRETENLHELLRQSENLVQDLQEELEMKDSLIVKELAVENYESQGVPNESYYSEAIHASFNEKKLDNSKEYRDEECHDHRVQNISLSNIEAELEAELERLELNINSSKLEEKLSNVAAIDQDFIAGVVQRELRTDLLGGETDDCSRVDQDGSGGSTPCSVHYAVSPRELSLRLHEVIQSRLEERVKELETALQSIQRKVRYMESEHMHSWRELSNWEAGSFVNQDSLIAGDEQVSTDQPVVINLSGEALAAYEAFDEFAKMTESDEEDTPSRFKEKNDQEIFHQCKQDGNQIQNSGYIQQNPFVIGNSPFLSKHGDEVDNGALLNNAQCTSEDENEDSDEEMERLLISQIVEKARKGSRVVLNAQKALFSNYEYGH